MKNNFKNIARVTLTRQLRQLIGGAGHIFPLKQSVEREKRVIATVLEYLQEIVKKKKKWDVAVTPWNTKAHNGLIEEKIELNLHLLSCLRSKTVHCRPWESLPVPEPLKYLLLGNLAQVLTPPIWRTAGKVALLLPRVTRIPGLSYFLESLKNLDPLTAMWPASVDIQPDKLGTWPSNLCQEENFRQKVGWQKLPRTEAVPVFPPMNKVNSPFWAGWFPHPQRSIHNSKKPKATFCAMSACTHWSDSDGTWCWGILPLLANHHQRLQQDKRIQKACHVLT